MTSESLIRTTAATARTRAVDVSAWSRPLTFAGRKHADDTVAVWARVGDEEAIVARFDTAEPSMFLEAALTAVSHVWAEKIGEAGAASLTVTSS